MIRVCILKSKCLLWSKILDFTFEKLPDRGPWSYDTFILKDAGFEFEQLMEISYFLFSNCYKPQLKLKLSQSTLKG